MDVLELLDTKTLKLINKSSSYTFLDKFKEYFFDRDYNLIESRNFTSIFNNPDLNTSVFYWRRDKQYCLKKYGHITFWDVSEIERKNLIPNDINEIFLWKNT
jgi:hypothetical protein